MEEIMDIHFDLCKSDGDYKVVFLAESFIVRAIYNSETKGYSYFVSPILWWEDDSIYVIDYTRCIVDTGYVDSLEALIDSLEVKINKSAEYSVIGGDRFVSWCDGLGKIYLSQTGKEMKFEYNGSKWDVDLSNVNVLHRISLR